MPPLNEKVGGIILVVGLAIIAIGLLWLFVRLLPVLRDLIVRGFKPALVILFGAAVAASPILLNKYAGQPVTDAKVEQKPAAGGGPTETHLTLTGAKAEEAAKLRLHAGPQLTVIQWADAAVTDADLEPLKDCPNLKELDLNTAAVTDAGLAVLAHTPLLEKLRIKGTKVTDAGFRAHVLPLAELKFLDWDGTAVLPATVREWRDAKPGRRADPRPPAM